MKRTFAALACALLLLLCLSLSACSGGASLFVFLSVRLKGNNDGTITAVAQNEFALGPSVLPVTLELYRTTGAAEEDFSLCESASSDDLDLFRSLRIVADADGGGYFFAKITYTVDGEVRELLSETVHYDANGSRL